MKAFKVDLGGITEVEMPDDFDESSDMCWDAFSLTDEHDVWVDDEGLFRAEVAVATFGSRRNIPLPAFVLGRDCDRTVGATMSLEELNGMVSIQGRIEPPRFEIRSEYPSR